MVVDKAKHAANQRKFYAAHRVYQNEWQKKKAQEYRRIVIEHYGNKCACCGEEIYQFLSIDHVNNDGAAHKKLVGASGSAMCRWIIKNHFPVDIQILCYNCNCAKGFYGKCPHTMEGNRCE